MRCRGRVVPLAAFIVLAFAVVTTGCGDGSDGEVDSRGAEPGSTVGVPEEFVAHGAFAATQGRLVAIGGSDPSDPSGPADRTSGRILDLKTGAISQLPNPQVNGAPVKVLDAAGLADRVVVLGLNCKTYVDEGPCNPSLPVSYRLNPPTSRWTPLALPSEVSAARFTSVTLLQALPGNRAVAVLRNSLSGEASEVLLVLGGDAWRLVGDVPAWTKGCATQDALYVLNADTDGDDPLTSTTTWSLTKTSLATGVRSEVPVPELTDAFATAGVKMGCSAAAVFLSTGAPQEVGVLYRLNESTWRAVPDALSGARNSAVDEIVTGQQGVIVRSSTIDADNGTPMAKVVGVNSTGDVTAPIAPPHAPTTAVWDGEKPELVSVSSSVAPEDAPQGGSGKAASVRRITVFK